MTYRTASLGALALLFVGSSLLAGSPAPTAIEPGTSQTYTCETEFTGAFSTNEVTLACAPSPSPSASPTASPTPTPTPAPTPTATPSPNPSPSPTPAPTATATPVPTAPAGANVSGKVIPPPRPGYNRVQFTEFPNTQALGQPPHPNTLQFLVPRPNLAGDCTYGDSSGRGRYCWRATTSEGNGVLKMWLHTETGACHSTGAYTQVHNSNGGCNYVAGPKWTLPNQDEFIVTYTARFDDIPGRKIAYLRWCGPKIGTPGYCEDNFVEGKLDGGSCKGNAFHHLAGTNQQQSKSLCIDLNDWHQYQMHVKPGQFVDFWLDGVLMLHATQGVSSDPSYWVFQSETYLGGQAIPIPHNQGNILIDNYAVDLPN